MIARSADYGECEFSLLCLRQGEFKVTERTMGMKELLGALDAGRVLEVFGAGTACVVCPVGSLLYRGKVRSSSLPSARVSFVCEHLQEKSTGEN